MPRWIASVLVLLATASLIPFACVFRARHSESPLPRVHLLQDMDNQPKYRAQRVNPLFADGRAARPPVAGTVPRSGFDANAIWSPIAYADAPSFCAAWRAGPSV